MTKTRFLGARIEPEIYEIINKAAQEENLDKTSTLKMLIKEGWKGIKLKKALQHYEKGLISVDKAASLAGITVSEMMGLIAANGVKSEETLEEYKAGVKLLHQRRSVVEIKKAQTLQDLFGSLKGLKIDAQAMKDEIRREDAARDRKLSRLIYRKRPSKNK